MRRRLKHRSRRRDIPSWPSDRARHDHGARPSLRLSGLIVRSAFAEPCVERFAHVAPRASMPSRKKAGVTKKTLYYHFYSKDELIAAYLESRDQPTLDLYARWFEAHRDRLPTRSGACLPNSPARPTRRNGRAA